MKKSILLTLTILMYFLGNTQQWIDKKYQYDSLLNVTYGSAINFIGETDSLKMDIYLPDCDDSAHVSTRPLLVIIHGGAFLEGSKNDASITSLCKQFAKRGYVTASIGYRLGFVSDDVAHSCNYPNYSCVFATDTAEWYRAYYRAVQDGKGAVRYLVNRHAQYRIDTSNIFVAGESAGGFIALGIGLLDTISEKLPQTYAIADAAIPHSSTTTCSYNAGKTFSTTVPRPDLGSIDGDIEPTTINYTIKGIGNIFGGMFNDLLKDNAANSTKPAIYSFHQPCDIVVPIDSGRVFAGLSWCMTNGYGCFGISNTPKLYGSRGFSSLNTNNSYGYTIHNEFTTTNFPYNFYFGNGSCVDQVNNPCHAYDSKTLRENNMAAFFAGLVSTNPICDTAKFPASVLKLKGSAIKLYPNPTQSSVTVFCDNYSGVNMQVLDIFGKVVISNIQLEKKETLLDLSSFASGIYLVVSTNSLGVKRIEKLIVQ